MSDEPTADAVAWRRYEQNRPRTEVAIDKAVYGDFVGTYQLEDGPFYVVSIRDGCLFVRVVGQSDIEIYPESETQFFMKVLPVQVTFIRDPNGSVDSLVHHQNGEETTAVRVSPELVERAEEELRKRVLEQVPIQGSEEIICRVVSEHIRAEPDYDSMSPALATLARQQFDIIQADLKRAGALKHFVQGSRQSGMDIYDLRFDNAKMEWGFALGADGKSSLYLRPSP